MAKNTINIGKATKMIEKDLRIFFEAAEEFSSHLIENGRHFSIKGRLKDGKIFIEEENVKETKESDKEYILYKSVKEKNKFKNGYDHAKAIVRHSGTSDLENQLDFARGVVKRLEEELFISKGPKSNNLKHDPAQKNSHFRG